MAYDYIPDMAEQAPRLVSSQFLSAPAMVAVLAGFGAGNQMEEDQLFDLSTSSGLGTAFGTGLDAWGDLVGLPRGPLNDTLYRLFIHAKGIANETDGLHDQIVACALAMGAFNCYTFTIDTFADVVIELVLIDLWNADVLRIAKGILGDCRAAGIGGSFVYSPLEAMRFDVGPGFDVSPMGTYF